MEATAAQRAGDTGSLLTSQKSAMASTPALTAQRKAGDGRGRSTDTHPGTADARAYAEADETVTAAAYRPHERCSRIR